MPMTLYPYLIGTTWVFDDESTGLKAEAFVMGMSEMISRMIEAKAIPNASLGFAMTFSDQPFDGADADLLWLREEEPGNPMGGNWYRGMIAGKVMDGWLCPALFCYFPNAPKWLYVKVDQLPAGVDPIWHVSPDDPRQRQFVAPDDDI